jgi:hypothetical protein
MSLNSQKYGFGIRDQEKTYSGSRGQKGTGSRIRIHNNVWQLRGILGRHTKYGREQVSGICVHCIW